jgi:hypothetical protein
VEPSPPLPSVEFERRRLAPAPSANGLHVVMGGPAATRFTRRLHGVRAAVVVLGALAVAFVTQRLGVGLGGALCAFLGVLPILWGAGWLFGLLVSARRLAADVSQHGAALPTVEGASPRWHLERVRLEVRDEGLRLERRGELGDGASTIAWRDVRFTRPGPDGALLGLGADEVLEVPASAFPALADFDAFCLALQAKVWEAARA